MIDTAGAKLASRWPPGIVGAACWSGLGLLLAADVGLSWNPTPIAEALAAVSICPALVHAALAYGMRNALVLFLICVVVTFAIENIGVAYGFPFGHYHFEVGPDLPHIGAIPLIVGPLWFGMGYFSWAVAATLLDGADRQLRQIGNLVVLPLVAAFVMTQWDVVMDAPSSTIGKAWLWHQGGADFGVPLTNFVGWLFTAWLFFQGFALYLRRQGSLPPQSRAFRLVAVLFYASAGLTHVVPWLIGQNGEVVDAGGHAWHIEDLRETTVVVMLFTMAFTSLLAVLRLATAKASAHADQRP